jgi:hypothetical protein
MSHKMHIEGHLMRNRMPELEANYSSHLVPACIKIEASSPLPLYAFSERRLWSYCCCLFVLLSLLS